MTMMHGCTVWLICCGVPKDSVGNLIRICCFFDKVLTSTVHLFTVKLCRTHSRGEGGGCLYGGPADSKVLLSFFLNWSYTLQLRTLLGRWLMRLIMYYLYCHSFFLFFFFGWKHPNPINPKLISTLHSSLTFLIKSLVLSYLPRWF